MRVENKKKNRLLLVLAGIIGTVFIGLLVFAIWDYIVSGKSVVRLGDYRSLSYTSTERDSAGSQVVEELVKRSTFGGQVKRNGESLYAESMRVYEDNANYLGITLSEYLKVYYGAYEEDFRKKVKESANLVAREEAVLDAVADREKIVLSETQFEHLLLVYMESVGYTERQLFLRDYNEKELRIKMRRDITTDYLLTISKGPALED